jgi:membrane protein DedA with SNARE-associated domain
MDAWANLTQTVWWLLDEHGLAMAFILLLLEESGVPPIIPGDLLMVLVGVQAAQGKFWLLPALLVLEVATVIGGSILYALSYIGGHAVINRVGPYVGATPERLKRIDDSLKRHGIGAIVLGRLVPSFCILTAVAAGLLGYPYRRFVLALAVGGFLHLLVFVLLGYWVGLPILDVLSKLHPPFELLAAILALAGLIAWLVRSALRTPATPIVMLPRAERLLRGLLSGLIGGLVSMLLANALLPIGGLFVRVTAFESLLGLQLARYGSVRAVAVVVAISFLAGAMLWGALFGFVQPRLPGPAWFRGVVFAIVPLTVSLLVIPPLLGGGVFGREPVAMYVPIVGEVVRSLVFGLTLGVANTVVSPHRPAKVTA